MSYAGLLTSPPRPEPCSEIMLRWCTPRQVSDMIDFIRTCMMGPGTVFIVAGIIWFIVEEFREK